MSASRRQAPSEREYRKRATTARLRDSATQLAGRWGRDQVTIDDICADAGVSRRTFFNHFATKDEAFLAWDASDDAYLAGLIVDRPRAESAVRAALWAMTTTAFAPEPGSRATVVREVMAHSPGVAAQATQLTRKVVRAVEAGIAARLGLPADSHVVRLGAVTAVAALTVTMRTAEAGEAERERLLEETCRVLDAGFLAVQPSAGP
ncbi:TetR/AcrR family transcriptional regulator [Streptomyces tubbatahanensis]|uniref:TetR/AcrR family transcriptional regulator n=1 Tax=Streptomyces tubbatahanensis TaxID=2923272 RepID=A0ABY3XLS7_9ACTN|nr:TetR/AcrR family transcriptional regulator [Streptomyces tubbatahanensis]UNS95371.1 TetR/AcrR family transcriptional regulator [Streptomyces tubbatahanensis]